MRRLLVALVVLAAWAAALAAPPTPTTLEIDCGNGFQTTPFNCNFLTKPQPQFRFNGTTGCNRYEIQVTSDNDFTDTPWFWDRIEPVACTATTTATFPSSSNGGSSGQGADDLPNDTIAGQTLWSGLRRFHWRVRVSDDGGSSWSAYSTASSGAFSSNTYPMMSEPLSVANGIGGGSIESYGDTSAGTTRNATTGTFASICASTVAGDTIALATGSYSGFSASTCAGAGTKAKPITITKQAGNTPTITGTLTLDRAYWTVDGLTLASASGAPLIYSAANLIVRNSTITGSGTTDAGHDYGAVLIGGDPSNYFVNNVVNITSTQQNSPADPTTVITPDASTDKVVRGNDISGTGSSRAIRKTGTETTMGGNFIVTDNEMHGLTGVGGGLPMAFYYASGHVYLARNYIRDNNDTNNSYHMQFLRGSWFDMRHNTIGREGGKTLYCLSISDQDGQPTWENNICIGTSIAFDMAGEAWLTQHKIQVRNSIFRRQGGGSIPDETNNTGLCGLDGTTCFTFTSVQGLTSIVDPALGTSGVQSGRPQSGSGISVNAGTTGNAIPTGASSPIDIGRFEYGATTGTATSSATGVYDYQSQWTVNTTPRISWTFVDGDNALHTAGQTQSAYEVQVDTSTYFDTTGDWKPYCSSGIVSSANAYWDVPTSCNLAPSTKYYFRVRTWDNVAAATTSNAGTWSDYVNAFTTAASDCTAYVDTVACSGDYSIANRSCTGTDGTSYSTWQAAIAAATAGQTICGRAGTYTENSFALQHTGGQGVNGTAGNPITYTNYNGETVIIDGSSSDNAHGGGTDKGVTIDNHADYVVFRGLKIRNGGFEGFDNRGDNVTVDQCDIYNNGTWESQNNVQNEDGADNFTLTRSKLYWDGSFVSNATRTAGGGCSTGEDRDCTSHNLYLQGNNATVKNNWIYDTLGNGAAVGASAAYGVQIGTTGLSYSGVTFAYNTIAYVATRAGILLYDDETNANIYNNIVKDASADGNSSGSISLQNTASTGNFVVNNLLQTVGATQGVTGTLATISGNIVGSDPLFVDYADRNLHVTGASPAIGAASATVTVADDFDGDARPINGTYDIGADEAAAAASTPGSVRGAVIRGGAIK